MPPENLSGYYRIISMTDGVVEHIGWLPLGGYRIGIRSPLGGYYYYAHLSSYAQDFQIGDHVEAGELLGLMGDTGYGEEGTRGRFPVHLHLGIYLTNAAGEEYSVNPYWVLRYLQTTDT
jgi:murein DD-endopeptidase MepM/ murein hydrolase activator NlpD